MRGAANNSDMYCRLDDEALQPWSNATCVIDGSYWPVSYAAAVLARYCRHYGDGALLLGHVCDHVAAVCGFDHFTDDLLGVW